MELRSEERLRELLDWRPEQGILSLYVSIDPADRSEAWRIDLRNKLRELKRPDGHDARRALEATTARVLERFPPDSPLPSGRTQIGFVEVAEKPGRDEWDAIQLPLPETLVSHEPGPVLEPATRLLNRARPRGLALVSSERVRLFEWNAGWLTELEDWELEVFSLDWRERKAQRPGDPASVQGAKASGRDQFSQRMEHNRERFLKEAGKLAAARIEAGTEILAFGDPEHVRDFAQGGGDRVHGSAARNLISAPTDEIQQAAAEAIERLCAQQETALAQRIIAESAGGTRAAVGPVETAQALDEGRVEHLLFDPKAEIDESGVGNGVPPAERLIERALATSAKVTPVEGAAAEALAEVGGVAALLRY